MILIGLMITPALYSWVNISGFWDPYGNTEHLKVAVVNEDKGATSEMTGHLDVGGQMIDKLHDNDELGWQFMDRQEAEDAVRDMLDVQWGSPFPALAGKRAPSFENVGRLMAFNIRLRQLFRRGRKEVA